MFSNAPADDFRIDEFSHGELSFLNRIVSTPNARDDLTMAPMFLELVKPSKIITVPKGRNLFRVLRENKIPIAQSCLGDGICATCYLQIIPPKNCTSPSKREQVLKEANKLPSHIRISCLLRVLGDISISTTYW